MLDQTKLLLKKTNTKSDKFGSSWSFNQWMDKLYIDILIYDKIPSNCLTYLHSTHYLIASRDNAELMHISFQSCI